MKPKLAVWRNAVKTILDVNWRAKKKKKKSKSELLCDATALTNILQSGKVLFEFSESASHEFIIEHIMDLMLPG